MTQHSPSYTQSDLDSKTASGVESEEVVRPGAPAAATPHAGPRAGAPHSPRDVPEVGSVEEFLLLWADHLPRRVKKLQVKRWSERDLPDGFSLTVRWPKDKTPK